MPFFTLGINHQTAPVDIREKLAFNREQIPEVLRALRELPEVEEAVILSTCNRTEIYCELQEDRVERILEWLAATRIDDDPTVQERFYTYRDADTVRHLIRVACGLDSLVLGEPQILGQLKDAYDDARAAGTVGADMHRLFQYAFQAAKQIRSETAIGASAVSVAYAAVSLARQIFGDLSGHTALLIGAGETIELAASYLGHRAIGRLIVANRTVARAQELAARYNGFALALNQIPEHLADADIVISSTASPDPVLRRAEVEAALAARRRKPIFMVDIAVPRDIEPSVGELEDIYLYTVDDLHNVIEENRASREQAAKEAEDIVAARAKMFIDRLRALDAVPVIRGVRSAAHAQKQRAVEEAKRMLAAGRSPEEALEWLGHTLTNRLLHAPSANLRQAAQEMRLDIVQAARELFDLDDPAAGEDED